MSSASSMADLLPIPLVFASSSSSELSSETVRLPMRTSARALPGGSLEFDAKEKRARFVPEAESTAREMDSLFAATAAASSSSAPASDKDRVAHDLPDLVASNPDCVVVRVLFAGGFASNALSAAHQQDQQEDKRASVDIARLKVHAAAPASAARGKQQQRRPASSVEDDLFFSGAAEAAASSVAQRCSPPLGLTVVGRVVAAGKNVQFLSEWIPDPEPTSIVPRGFKEGDLVVGLLLLPPGGSPPTALSGALTTYALVPACFLMRLDKDDLVQSSAVGLSQTTPVSGVLAATAATLLPATLWNGLLRWHVDPKSEDDTFAIVCVGGSTLASPLLPASVGAAMIAVRAAMMTTDRDDDEDGGIEGTSHAARRQHRCTILATSEDEAVLLERRIEQQQQQGEASPLFAVSRQLFLRGAQQQHRHHQTFHHVIVCDDAEEGRDRRSEEDDEHDEHVHPMVLGDGDVAEDNDDDDGSHPFYGDADEVENASASSASPSTSQQQRSSLLLADVLPRILRPGGTVALLSTRIHEDCESAKMRRQKRVAASILPAVLLRSGRFAALSTSSLASLPADCVRPTIAESLALIVSGALMPSEEQPHQRQSAGSSSSSGAATLAALVGYRLHRVDPRGLDPLNKQFRQLVAEHRKLLAAADAETGASNNSSNSNTAAEIESKRIEMESRWRTIADSVGAAVEEMLAKILASASASSGVVPSAGTRRPSAARTLSNVVVQFPT